MITARKKLLEYLKTHNQREAAKKTKLCQATISKHARGEGGDASPATIRGLARIGITAEDFWTVTR